MVALLPAVSTGK